MQVIIQGKIFNYVSDFDPVDIQNNVRKNWRVSAGDYFKFPVDIGGVDCFIKRFDKRGTDISGYEFLRLVKGARQKGLPLVYDIVNVKEGNRDVIYLFTEYLPGQTLDSLQRTGFQFVPLKLASDLFSALTSIHQKGYWFPDFDPKNLYMDHQGNFFIIDLDSTYPLAALPQAKMFGSKDYWSPVYNFYRGKMNFTSAEIKQLKGDAFNTLHLLYFMGLYSFYLSGQGEDLTAPTLEELNDYLSSKYPLFTSTMRYCFYKMPESGVLRQRPLSWEVFSSFISTCLFPSAGQVTISSKTAQKKVSQKPKVNFYIKGNKKNYYPGEPYTLSWNTANVSTVVLDGSTQPLSGSKSYLASADNTHTLRATSQENGIATNVDTVIAVKVEPKPSITLTAWPRRVRSGKMTRISWRVADGSNIALLINGVVHSANRPNIGYLDLVVEYDKTRPGPQMVNTALDVKSISGINSYRSPQVGIQVLPVTKNQALFWVFGLLALVIIILSARSCSGSSYSAASPESNSGLHADSTASGASTPGVMTDSTKMVTPADTEKHDTAAAVNSPMVDSAKVSADSSASPVTETQFTFSDEFTDNAHNWPLPNSETISTDISDGNLHIKLSTNGGNGVTRYFPVDPENFILSARMAFLSGDRYSTTYGVYFCGQSLNSTFYYFFIKPDGHYGIFYYKENWTNLASGYSSFINKDVYFNRLIISATQHVFDFYVNGEKLESLSIPDVAGKRFGIYLENINSSVVMDNFHISGRQQP